MALRMATLTAYITADTKGLDKGLREADRKLDGAEKETSSRSKRMGAAVGAAAVVGVAAAATAAVGFLSGTKDAASDLAETLSKSTVVFGDQAQRIQDWSRTAATSFGMSQQAALGAAAQFGDMFQQLGFTGQAAADNSTKLVQMAADLGSFHNVDPTDVLDRIGAAMRGEYDSLQQLIPNINAARVEHEALAMTGKTAAKELTAQEKATATLAIIQKDGAAAAGDFARTSEGAANRQRTLTAQITDAQAAIGQKLLPAYAALLGFISNTVIPGLTAVGKWMSDNATAIKIVTGVLGAAAVAYGTYRLATLATRLPMAALTAAQWLMNAALAANPIGLVIAALAGLAAAFVFAYKNSETFRAIVDKSFRVVAEAGRWMWERVLRPAWSALSEAMENAQRVAERVAGGIGRAWGNVREAFAAPVRFVVNSVYNDGIRRFYNAIADKIPGLPSLPHVGLAFAQGGQVGAGRRLQAGPNPATGDVVPAWLRPDEFIIRGDGSNLAEAIDHFGVPLALGGLVGAAWDKLKGAGSAVAGAVGNAAGWVRDLASKAGGAVAEAALGPLRGLVDRTLGGLGGPGAMAGGLAKAVIDKAIDLVKSRDVMESGLGLAGQPLGVRRMMDLLNGAFGNVRLISGLRPGAITATGNPSYHGKGRAVDIPPVMAYFDWIARNFPNSRELIFSPAGGRQIHNGRKHMYSGITRAMHWDHVHWAYDRGGLARGAGLLPKMTNAPERVLSPEQTRAFERLVEVLDRGSLAAVQAGPVPVEKHLHYHAAVGRSMPEDDFVDAAGRARMLGW